MTKCYRSRKARGRKKVAKKTAKTPAAKKTPKAWAPKKGGYVIIAKQKMGVAFGRICKVVKVNSSKTFVAVMYNYNGQIIVVPYDLIKKAPDGWKKTDPVSSSAKNKDIGNRLPTYISEQLQDGPTGSRRTRRG